MNRHELTNRLRTMPDNNSNLKFHKLLKSRLVENDIPLKDAVLIAMAVKYDFSNIPEDNDSLSEFATELADWCGRAYKQALIASPKNIEEVIRFLVPDFVLKIESL